VTYRVKLSRKAEKFLVALRDKELQQRLVGAIRGLEAAPRSAGCVKLTGSTDLFRLRVGDYRIVYQIQDNVLVVLVIEIGHRREIYR
jgi:mRNA interferase RelE/StbE